MTDIGHTRPRTIGANTNSSGAGLTLLDHLYAWRDRLLASRTFQRGAAAFPLTRPIARAQAQSLFDLCAGFVYSQVLLSFVRLRIHELLSQGPRTAADIAAACNLEVEPCTRLLDAAVALKLLSRRTGERYGLGMLGAAIRANPGAIAMVEHNALLYSDLANPLALMRADRPATKLGEYWAYARSDDPADLGSADTTSYTALMAETQSLIAEDIIEAYPLRSHHRLLDVGGGDGTLLSAVARHAPQLELALFDLPSVVEKARARLAAEAPKASIHGGSFFSEPLPAGADVVTLVRVLLDHDDDAALQILQNVRRAIAPGGTLLVAETLSGMRGVERVSDAYFGMYLMAMGSGRPRSFGTLARLLAESGFSQPKLVRTRHPMLTCLIKSQASC